MKVPAIHYNPPGSDTRTPCGRPLRRVEHRPDLADVTCNSCLRIARKP